MADAGIQAVVGKLIEYSADALKHQVSYLCCYSCNVQTLADEIHELKIRHETVQQDVDAARANLGVITPEVESWLGKVDDLQSRSSKIIGDAQEIKRSCMRKWFPVLHYSLSRNAMKTTTASIELREKKFDKISNPGMPADIAPVPSTSDVGFESRDYIEGRIMEALKDASVYSIGIWGIGGVGKTTMAKKIEERVRDDKSLFEHVVMVVVSQQPDLLKIQSHIAEGLGLKLSEESPVYRSRKLHQRLLSEKGILIILDDLWGRLDLKELGIPSQSSHAGCKLILTSRNRDALTSTGVPVPSIFSLKVLTEEESWKFFKDCSGIVDDDSHDDLVQIAKKVERECKGLPLALKTVGCALRGRGKSFWENAVRELVKSVPDNIPDVIEHVYRPLLYSINALEGQEQKDLFLLCCLFPEDYSISIEELLRCGVGLQIFEEFENLTAVRDKVETILRILLSRSLLIEGTGFRDYLYVRMHDVIRDVGIWIAKEEVMVGSNKEKHKFMIRHGEKGWPTSHSNYTCISLLFSRHHNISFPESIDCPKLEFLRLDLVESIYRKRYIKLPENFFNGMGGLKVLEASFMKVLPPSIGQLNNLRTLFLHGCKTFETPTVLGKLVNLEILSFRACEFKVLPMEIGGLKKLKTMDISYCGRGLRVAFGVVSGLVRLEELMMLRSFDNWEAEGGGENHNACLSELNGLKNLTTLKIEIRNPSVVPRQKPLWVQKVKKYDITVSNLYVIKHFGTNGFRKAICLGEVVNPLGDWIYDMARNAEFFQLEGSNCMTFMKELSQYSGDLSCLKELRLYNFTDILYLAEGQQNGAIFPMLESLDIRKSDSLQQISDVSLPIGSFVALQSIYLINLSGLMCLWKFSIQGQLYLGNLTSLTIQSCNKLAYLFSLSIAQSLVQLSSLDIYDCRTMKEIFQKEDGESGDIKLPKLSILNLSHLNSFCRLCNGIDSIELPELRELSLINLPSIKMMEGDNNEVHQQYLIPKAAGINFNFCGLRTLTVNGIGNFKCMFPPSVISGVPNLRKLEVEFCSMLEHVIGKDDKNIEEMILFPNLHELKLSNLPNILTFCYNDIQLPSLEQLDIDECPMMVKFVEELHEHTSNARPFINKQVQCPNLKLLKVSQLNISGMFSSLSFKSLTNLEELDIAHCKELEYMIIEEEGQIVEREFIQRVSLKNFWLLTLPKLCGYVFQMKHHLEFPLLEEISIANCPLLKKFACESLHLPKLKRVWGLLNIEVATNFFFHKEMSFPEIQLENNCFILSIEDISFNDNRKRLLLAPDSSESFVNVVSFRMGQNIVGKFKTKKIHTGTNYEIILMIMLDEDASEWEGLVEIELKLPEGSKLQRIENLGNQPTKIWTEISLGRFVIREPQQISEELEFSLCQREGMPWNRILIKGVRIKEV